MQTEIRELELGSSLESRIGNTPLIRLDRVVGSLPGITLLAKAEWHNPGGSVKDRAAAAMIREAMVDGRLGPGKTLLDATSGNTGIALAMLGAALGIPVVLVMPSNVSPERKRILKAFASWPVTIHSGSATWINTPTKPTGARTTRRRDRRSGDRPKGTSLILWLAWGQAAHLWARHGG